MGFEDDVDYNNSFENDTPDLDNGFGEKPKKLSRKELREAKKKNAEKTADLPKQKKGFFSRRERMDDDDSLSGQHLFDPTQETKISTPRERRSDYDTGPIRNDHSEFSYLFDPADDDETEDDVYPDESIYSDSSAAKDLLGGLAYDEAKDGDSAEFDKYFNENAEVRPPSKFSFHRREQRQNDAAQDLSDMPDITNVPPAATESDNQTAQPTAHEPVKVVPHPIVKSENAAEDSYLPDLRPDSVFAPTSSEQQPSEPPYYAAPGTEEREESYMPQENNDFRQDYMPYQMPNVYQPYPMQPMNQMMGYPVIIPNAGQNPGASYQAIPIPYPVPMPYPMYSQGYYPPYPPGYPPGYPPYGGDYYGRYPAPPPNYDDRYDNRRGSRCYDDRYDRRREPDRHYDPYYDERYDDRARRDRGSYPEPPYRPPYQPPYERDGYERHSGYDERNEQPQSQGNARYTPEPIAESRNDPIYTPQPEPNAFASTAAEPKAAEPVTTPETYEPITSTSAADNESKFSNFDFTFNKPAETSANQATDSFEQNDFGTDSFEQNDFGTDSFGQNDFGTDSFGQNDLGTDSFAQNDFSANQFGNSDFNDFGSDYVSGFENDSQAENNFNFDNNTGSTDASATPPVEEGKPRGGRFKKRR
ncbi:MAG: hypothetical protein ACI4IJ_03335 [Acutalibacteraceae bacterium]